MGSLALDSSGGAHPAKRLTFPNAPIDGPHAHPVAGSCSPAAGVAVGGVHRRCAARARCDERARVFAHRGNDRSRLRSRASLQLRAVPAPHDLAVQSGEAGTTVMRRAGRDAGGRLQWNTRRPACGAPDSSTGPTSVLSVAPSSVPKKTVRDHHAFLPLDLTAVAAIGDTPYSGRFNECHLALRVIRAPTASARCSGPAFSCSSR